MPRHLHRARYWPVLPLLDAYVLNALIQKVALAQLQANADGVRHFEVLTTQGDDLVRVAQREVLRAVEARDVSIEVLNYDLPLLHYLAQQCRDYAFPTGQISVRMLAQLTRRLGISERRISGQPHVAHRWRVLRDVAKPFIGGIYDDFPVDPAEWNNQEWWLFFQWTPEAPFALPIMHAVQELALDEPEMFTPRSRLLFADFF